MASLLIDRFFRELDREWIPIGAARLRLDVLGASALAIRHGYDRGTKDVDVLETSVDRGETTRALRRLAGRETPLAIRRAMYLDVIAAGIPFLPRSPRWHAMESLEDLDRIEVRVLDVVDVAVSKLRRFSPQDRFDIEWTIAEEHVSHQAFVERFRSAVESEFDSARAEDLPKVVANFHVIEREGFASRETTIGLPSWI